MWTFTHTKESLEENFDVVKVSVLGALVRDGLLDAETADKWCEEHGIIMLKKTVFKSLRNLWSSSDKELINSNHFIHVAKIDPDLKDRDDLEKEDLSTETVPVSGEDTVGDEFEEHCS